MMYWTSTVQLTYLSCSKLPRLDKLAIVNLEYIVYLFCLINNGKYDKMLKWLYGDVLTHGPYVIHGVTEKLPNSLN